MDLITRHTCCILGEVYSFTVSTLSNGRMRQPRQVTSSAVLGLVLLIIYLTLLSDITVSASTDERVCISLLDH